jgi:N-acetylmuramoyl-L-alanine amidase-like protein
MKIGISSGHGLYVRGASGILDEVNEARRVVNLVAEKLLIRGLDVFSFHDDTSHSQSENLETIVNWHNGLDTDLAVSVHFNAYVETTKPMGTEVLYVSQSTLAGQVSAAISRAGQFINRGPKKRTDLYFLNKTDMPAILLEICFVDSQVDAALYGEHFAEICEAIAAVIRPEEGEDGEGPEAPLLVLSGRASWFGGPADTGVAPDEGLAFIYEIDTAPHLFLPYQPEGTTGLARRLNSTAVAYCACRWSYDKTPHEMLLSKMALVRTEAGKEMLAFPADWGPHPDTGRVLDGSPYLLRSLGIQTDDSVEVIFPAPEY